MNIADELKAWRTERNRVLTAMDIAAARKQMPGASDEVVEIALHKARYDCTDMPDALRHESASWLRSRGYGALGGPLLNEGELPR